MAYAKKVRISIAVMPELDERIEKMANRLGVSKANLCSMLVAQQIDTFEQTWNMLGNPQLMGQMLSTFAPDVNQKEFAEKYSQIVKKELNEK